MLAVATASCRIDSARADTERPHAAETAGQPASASPAWRSMAASRRSILPSSSPEKPGRMSALSTSETREPKGATASVARLTTSKT